MFFKPKKSASLLLTLSFVILGAVIGTSLLLRATGLVDMEKHAHQFAALDIALLLEAFQACPGAVDIDVNYPLSFPTKTISLDYDQEKNQVIVKANNIIASRQTFSLSKEFKINKSQHPMVGLIISRHGNELSINSESQKTSEKCVSLDTRAGVSERRVVLINDQNSLFWDNNDDNTELFNSLFNQLNVRTKMSWLPKEASPDQDYEDYDEDYVVQQNLVAPLQATAIVIYIQISDNANKESTQHQGSDQEKSQNNQEANSAHLLIYYPSSDIRSQKLACLIAKNFKTSYIGASLARGQYPLINHYPGVILQFDKKFLDTDLKDVTEKIFGAIDTYYTT